MVKEVARKNTAWILVLALLLFSGFLNASEADTSSTAGEHNSGKFSPGPFIFDHIGDAYSWHILSIHKKDGHVVDVGIPLPIIVYSEKKGFHVFMSSRFEHGHAAYQGFKIAGEGPNKGKIVEIMQDGSEVKPLDISITKNVTALFISLGLMLWIFLSVAGSYKRNPASAPKGMQSALEPFIVFIRDDVAKPLIGDHKYERYMPFLLTIFFFIWINNMMGLIPIFPGGANVTGNIAVTLVLAIITFIITTISGNRDYWLHIINMPGVPWWLKIPIPLMPFIEILGVFIKPFVLMVRLFANITAGHIIALGFFSLIFIFGEMHPVAGYSVSILSILFTVFMTMLELLVALIQAYVFTLLSALYFGMATTEHSHSAEHH